MPTWRWLLALTLVAAVTLYAGWLRDWIALLLPNAEGPGTAIRGALALVVTIGFSTGVLVGGTTILLALCGLGSGYVVVICVAGIAIAPAILAFAPKLVSFRFRFGSASSALAEAARRLAACASSPTQVKVEAYVSAHRRFDRCVLKSPCHLLRMRRSQRSAAITCMQYPTSSRATVSRCPRVETWLTDDRISSVLR
jgi:hypothetical protein